MMEDFTLGFRTWIQSWSFISRNGLMHYFLYPLIIGILWYMGMTIFILEFVKYLWAEFGPEFTYVSLPQEDFWGQVKAVVSEIGKYAMAFVIALLLLYSSFKVSKYIILIAMSPIMSLLSEKTNDILEGTNHPFSMQQLIRDVFRGILLALRNMFLELIIIWSLGIINIFITLAIPPLGIVLSPLIVVVSFLVGAYFFGFSTMDYTNERRRLSIRESIKVIRNRKGIALANGTIFALMFRIPVLGATICTITCTVAACLAMKDQVRSPAVGSRQSSTSSL